MQKPLCPCMEEYQQIRWIELTWYYQMLWVRKHMFYLLYHYRWSTNLFENTCWFEEIGMTVFAWFRLKCCIRLWSISLPYHAEFTLCTLKNWEEYILTVIRLKSYEINNPFTMTINLLHFNPKVLYQWGEIEFFMH